MSIMIYCDNKNKKCGKESPAELKLEDKKQPEECGVFCTECGEEIKNVSVFTKRNLFFAKQVQQKSQPGESFAIRCEHCTNSRRPIVKDKKVFCQVCEKEIQNISPFYKNLLISQTSNGR